MWMSDLFKLSTGHTCDINDTESKHGLPAEFLFSTYKQVIKEKYLTKFSLASWAHLLHNKTLFWEVSLILCL